MLLQRLFANIRSCAFNAEKWHSPSNVGPAGPAQGHFFPILIGWVFVLNRALLPPSFSFLPSASSSRLPPSLSYLPPASYLHPTSCLLLPCPLSPPQYLNQTSPRERVGTLAEPMRNLCAGHTPRSLAALSNQQYLNRTSQGTRGNPCGTCA